MSNIVEAISKSAAIRLRQRLQPEGGAGDKIFPPTFAGGVYCWEQRCFSAVGIPPVRRVVLATNLPAH